MQLDFLKAGARSYSEGVRHQVFDDAQAVYDHMEEINPHEVSEQPSSVRLSEGKWHYEPQARGAHLLIFAAVAVTL